ncbi:MAG: hypothetical protein CSA49_03435 [Gammaproteobacteria bacterium]|nr:MAG: hypothetical protein CSA49_03435 [Gammaproteobacteria bacterium]
MNALTRLISATLLTGLLGSISGGVQATPLSYNDCISNEECIFVVNAEILTNIDSNTPTNRIGLELLLKEENSAETNPGNNAETRFQQEISQFLSSYQNRSIKKPDQNRYANYYYKKDLGSFKRVHLSSNERSHVQSVLNNTFSSSGTKASRDMLSVAMDKTKAPAAAQLPSDPYILHKVVAFHVALVLIGLIFLKVSDR